MEIAYNLKKEIETYCKLNNISDINLFFNKILKQGFSIEKYGMLTNNEIKKEIIIEPIIEEEKTKPITEIKPNIINNVTNKDMYGE